MTANGVRSITMRIDASRVCKEALGQQPDDRDLGTALVFAANTIYRKRSAEIGLAVLKLIEQYAGRFGKTRLEVMEEIAQGKVTIERITTRFPMKSALPPQLRAQSVPVRTARAGMGGARELVAMGYRLLARTTMRDQ
jgi:hypothetical protein